MVASLTVYGQGIDRCANAPSYDYKTKLKGGYRIVFQKGRLYKNLSLWKGNRRVRKFGPSSCGLLNKNLGYVGADFQEYFALVQSFGSGNPHYVELIRKRDGKNRFVGNRETCWIDASERHSVFLFSRQCVPKSGDKMILMNVNTMRKRYLDFPQSILSEPDVLGRIRISSVSRRELVLEFSSFNGSKSFIKKYKL